MPAADTSASAPVFFKTRSEPFCINTGAETPAPSDTDQTGDPPLISDQV